MLRRRHYAGRWYCFSIKPCSHRSPSSIHKVRICAIARVTRRITRAPSPPSCLRGPRSLHVCTLAGPTDALGVAHRSGRLLRAHGSSEGRCLLHMPAVGQVAGRASPQAGGMGATAPRAMAQGCARSRREVGCSLCDAARALTDSLLMEDGMSTDEFRFAAVHPWCFGVVCGARRR